MVAWAFIGIDGTLATLYVVPSHRGQGLATHIARELILRLGRKEYGDLGFLGESGWVHSDVKEGNRGSEGVMRGLGGEKSWDDPPVPAFIPLNFRVLTAYKDIDAHAAYRRASRKRTQSPNIESAHTTQANRPRPDLAKRARASESEPSHLGGPPRDSTSTPSTRSPAKSYRKQAPVAACPK
ncbi:hypothetical protein EYC84_003034 [Monilinia fructicola]|uniref:N-acetyltransferase domain-containing protein n=1 Tax=Monilinia fructicola TaxID=38448 RepID=A0A5M9JXG9_MONFR|nr:hypothetical protein EYC84_003034 [Monilinia fructicola]